MGSLLGWASCGGDTHDKAQIASWHARSPRLAQGGLQRRESHLRRATALLVRQHRARIERVAEALLARSILSERALDKLAAG
jgi:hypothetical protein